MKAFLAVLVLSIGCLRAETFEHVTHSFPLGTEKEDLLAKEPSATVIPCLVRPIDSARLTECRVVMRRDSGGALMTQFYLVDGRIAAISLARKSFPGTPFDSRADTEYLRNNQKLATFCVLRVAKGLNPIDVTVDQYASRGPREVALVVASPDGSEAGVLNTDIFDPKSFFMESTPANREKITKSKEAIEEQKKQYGR